MAAGPPDLDPEVLRTVGRWESQQVGGRGLLSSLSLPLCAASPCPGPGAASGCPRGLHLSALRPASNPTLGFSSGLRAMCLSSWVSWVLANGFC